MKYLRVIEGPLAFPGGSDGKESACNAEGTGDSGSIPGSGRSLGGGNCRERSLAGHGLRGHKESDTTEVT